MPGHPELEKLRSPTVTHKITLERSGPATHGSTPGGAISKAPGGYKVNDLNPATQAAHPNGFGTSSSKAEALKHLRAIEYFKHHEG